MNDYEFGGIEKCVVALGQELIKFQYVGFLWGHSPYKELKWVHHHPVQYGLECAIKRIGKLLKKKERDKITWNMVLNKNRELANLIGQLWDNQ